MIGNIDRITIDPKVFSGKPVFKGTRIPISIVLKMLRDGATFQKILEEYPRLSEETLYYFPLPYQSFRPLFQ